jgi:hypothetical protein
VSLDKFDAIQVYRGGVDLVRITFTQQNQAGRSVYLEVNDFRRRLLHAHLESKAHNPYMLMFFGGALTLLGAAVLPAIQSVMYRMLFK